MIEDLFTCSDFNNLAKVNDLVVEVWSKILQTLPASKLYLKCKQLGDKSVQMDILQRFMSHGVDPDRITLSGEIEDRVAHLLEYKKVDTEPTACSKEAKLCPDGTYVGRTGPNCEFVCPTIIP